MTEGSSDRLVDELLERVGSAFQLEHPLAGGSLGDLVVDAIRAAQELEEPAWGDAGDASVLRMARRGPLRFTYRPHLFPGMDDALRLGHRVQFSQLPRELADDSPLEIAAVLESYCHLSGDLIGWHQESRGPLTVWMLDVSGHGVRAGFAAVVMKLLLAELAPQVPLDALAGELHRRFLAARNPDDPACLYATGVFLRAGLDGSTEYLSAGHVPVLVRRESGKVEQLGSTGFPIALLDDPALEVRPITLEPGDLVVLATDGLFEACDREGVPLGLDRVGSALASGPGHPADVARVLYREVERHHDLTRLDDDLTFLVARPRRPGPNR